MRASYLQQLYMNTHEYNKHILTSNIIIIHLCISFLLFFFRVYVSVCIHYRNNNTLSMCVRSCVPTRTTKKQEKSEHNYLRCRDSLCHSTHTSAIETWVRNRALLRTLVFIFVLKSSFTTISGTFWALFFFWPGKPMSKTDMWYKHF